NPWRAIADALGFATVEDPRRRHIFVGDRPAPAEAVAAFHAARERTFGAVLAAGYRCDDRSLA
ncbi:MAG TPA: hypothetical protein VFG47_18175, partial [Geminicoccaceae bacterium]|nr:hypothetical protein [Geminicoccaceae bacterium]